ncbi:aldo/keto reductase [Phaeovulum sp. W22_SRMD_FR3]|uniref:aldo/keto reductase n=1 Tax=Phaeovulum sp. W22_SRMD_FR3 TaxID=3240274 RepID=UPI003F9B3338
MDMRKMGPLAVSAIGLGCMGLSQAYGVQDEAASVRTLHRAVDLGVTFFDTAEIYGPLRNEQLLGRALKASRDRLVIATKFGFTYRGDRHDFGEATGTDGSPANARRVAEASLRRLQTDVIDLYYLHRPDPAVPIEESVGAMADLVREGKVRAIGLSEVSPEALRRAQATHPIAALQSEYSLWTRDVETNGILQTCRELGIAFVPFSPLGRGFLTGTLPPVAALEPGDFRRTLPRFQPENAEANAKPLRVIAEIAQAQGASAAQVALAWVLAQGADIIPIPGAKRIPHLEENVAATDLRLSAAALTRLDAAFAPENIAGHRYPEVWARMVGT